MANIESPMAGKVFKINVKVGDTIVEDDEVIILEAMKMETPIYAAEG
ncbi:MAG: biotin/lipoyl-containing protein, partial [Desulfosporosinus sp.]